MQTANGYQQGNNPRIGYTVILMMAILFVLLMMATSCSTVHKTSKSSSVDSSVVTFVDSVHVKKYDTSVITHEINEYQTKTIELFDTIRTVKDSFITVLKSRIIYTSGSQSKDEIKKGISVDSTSRIQHIEANLKKTDKEVKKDSSRFQIFIIGLIIFFLLLIAFVSYKLTR